uniref:Fibronectin type-III domain-containing protein n=1 Tax=Arion vulgaris TaxID=1028688 RepID=A0A0B7A5N3_9EUPU
MHISNTMGLKICPCALCLIILVGFSSSVQFSSSPYAVTGEAYLFVGEDLRLYCTLSEEFLQNFNASDISFTFQYQTEANTTCVPASDVHIVDSNVAMLIIHNITFQNVGPYSCYVGGPYCHDQYSKDSQYVGVSDDISIEYSPQNVTNFKCVLYNWDEFMNCTWQHPVEYRNVENIKVTTIYAVARDISAECPKETNTSCTWYKENLRLARIYYVQVNVINTKNNATATSLFWFKPFALVKPEPVQNLKIIAVSEESPGCLLLSWSHARIFRNKVYRIKHQNETDKEFYVLYDNLTETNMTICGYLPYTFQNFSVECYPTSGYWSEPVYAGNTTPMIAPSEGPRVTNGSFTSTPCVGSQRKVVLMWQEVEVSAQNGIIDGYLIKSGETDLANVTANTYSATVDIPCYTASELHIFAHNKGGYSQKPAVLVIHPVTVICK